METLALIASKLRVSKQGEKKEIMKWLQEQGERHSLYEDYKIVLNSLCIFYINCYETDTTTICIWKAACFLPGIYTTTQERDCN